MDHENTLLHSAVLGIILRTAVCIVEIVYKSGTWIHVRFGKIIRSLHGIQRDRRVTHWAERAIPSNALRWCFFFFCNYCFSLKIIVHLGNRSNFKILSAPGNTSVLQTLTAKYFYGKYCRFNDVYPKNSTTRGATQRDDAATARCLLRTGRFSGFPMIILRQWKYCRKTIWTQQR